MTFKKDYNELLLHLLRGLVKDALHFEEIVSGSSSGLTHIDVKVEELQSKVMKLQLLNHLCLCLCLCLCGHKTN